MFPRSNAYKKTPSEFLKSWYRSINFTFVWICAILLVNPGSSCGQGHVPVSDKSSFKGVLLFTPEGTLSSGVHSVYSSAHNKTDPMISPKEWVRGKSASVRGIVQDAVLFFEWWTLLGDPIERYQFKWKSSGYYDVSYQEGGAYHTKTVTRRALAKYPDLVKWFDNIAPNNINFEIDFATGRLDDKKYYEFRRKHNILESLGSSGYSVSFRRRVEGIDMLFERSDKNPPFIVPTMATGGWREFMTIPASVSNEKLEVLVQLFKLGQTVSIKSFRIVSIDWPVDGMIALAKRFEAYEEKGTEPSPKEMVAAAEDDNLKKMQDDFWNKTELIEGEMEVYTDPTSGKKGLKSVNGMKTLPPTYYSIEQSSDKRFFYCFVDNNCIVINSFGNQITSEEGYTYAKDDTFSANQQSTQSDWWTTYEWEVFYFKDGTFRFQHKAFRLQRRLFLFSVPNDMTKSERDRLDERDARAIRKEQTEIRTEYINRGYHEIK